MVKKIGDIIIKVEAVDSIKARGILETIETESKYIRPYIKKIYKKLSSVRIWCRKHGLTLKVRMQHLKWTRWKNDKSSTLHK